VLFEVEGEESVQKPGKEAGLCRLIRKIKVAGDGELCGSAKTPTITLSSRALNGKARFS